jgi:cobaltochelatase CobN
MWSTAVFALACIVSAMSWSACSRREATTSIRKAAITIPIWCRRIIIWRSICGLAATVQTLRGKAPRIAHVDTSRPEAPLSRSLSQQISRVVRGRAANPKWIAGVMRHGYKGAFEIAATVDYLFGFAASTNAVSNHHFDQLFAAYLQDERVRTFMAAANPAALSETAARFAEAIRRGLWTPRSNRAADLIAELLATTQKETA